MKILSLATILFMTPLLWAQQGEPKLLTQAPPFYHPLARAAKIMGPVELEYVIDADGAPAQITVLKGHPILANAAKRWLESWRFETPSPENVGRRFRSTIEYAFDDKLTEEYDRPGAPPKVNMRMLDTYRHVLITTSLSTGRMADHCPTDVVKAPTEIAAGDYVELGRSTCYGTCPAYTVRISADGDVQWRGEYFVRKKGLRTAKIDPAIARALLLRFADSSFFQLCGSYWVNVTDSATDALVVQLGGVKKQTSNYARTAPRIFDELANAVDAAANSKRWIGRNAKR